MYSYIAKTVFDDHLGSNIDLCYIQNRVIINRVIKRLRCRKIVIRVVKTKALISFTVTAKLFYIFVFAHAKIWFSHDAALIVVLQTLNEC